MSEPLRGTGRGSQSVSVGFVSLGCAKNLVDAQVMAGTVLRNGCRLAPRPEEADVVVVNTCAFIREARQESLQAVKEACQWKASGRCASVLVTGCLPQRFGRSLLARFPQLDAVLGVDELDQVADAVRGLRHGRGQTIRVTSRPKRLFDSPIPGLAFSGGAYAWVKIAEGCDHACRFCVIPSLRGRYRSRSIRAIVQEAEALLTAGFRELVLIAQDVTAYGRDLRRGEDLTALLRRIAGLGNDFWIRLLYGYPIGITDALLETMAELPNVCRYLDVPIQHSHPDLLRAMGRWATVSAVRTWATHAREMLGAPALRTTLLVGFPGEDAKHQAHLEHFVEQTRFDHLGVFVYSPEAGTPATRLPKRPDRQIAERRRRRLLHIQNRIVEEKAKALQGQEDMILLDRVETQGKELVGYGRSYRQAPEVDGGVWVRKLPSQFRRGDFIRIRYQGFCGFDFQAEALDVAPSENARQARGGRDRSRGKENDPSE